MCWFSHHSSSSPSSLLTWFSSWVGRALIITTSSLGNAWPLTRFSGRMRGYLLISSAWSVHPSSSFGVFRIYCDRCWSVECPNCRPRKISCISWIRCPWTVILRCPTKISSPSLTPPAPNCPHEQTFSFIIWSIDVPVYLFLDFLRFACMSLSVCWIDGEGLQTCELRL